MKKSLLSLALIAGLCFPTMAGNTERKNKRNGNAIEKELNLTEDQKNKIQSINDEFKTRKEDLRKESTLSKDERTVKFKELAEAKRTKTDEILTSDQKNKLAELKEKSPQVRSHHKPAMAKKNFPKNNGVKPGKRDGFRGERTKRMQDLNFTDAQKEAMKSLREELKTKKDALDNMALTKADRIEKNKELRNEHRNKVNQLLTEEHKSKAEKSRAGKNKERMTKKSRIDNRNKS